MLRISLKFVISLSLSVSNLCTNCACSPEWKRSCVPKPPAPQPYSSNVFSRKWSELQTSSPVHMSQTDTVMSSLPPLSSTSHAQSPTTSLAAIPSSPMLSFRRGGEMMAKEIWEKVQQVSGMVTKELRWKVQSAMSINSLASSVSTDEGEWKVDLATR